MPGPFIFRDYGTFTGPGSLSGNYDYDLSSAEINPAVGGKPPEWSTDLPTDTSFGLTDLGMVLFHAPGDYVGFYSPGSSTQVINLAHSTGEIPLFNIQSKNTIHSGKIIVNDSIICNGAVLCNVTIAGPTITAMVADTQLAKNLPVKPFDIPHPSNGEGHRLRYVCLEGPEVGVYFRGRLTNKTEIELPLYWKDLVHIDSISVQLQPIGSHQDIIIKKVDEKKIYLQTNGGIPIDCYYHVYAERKDVERLIVEYEGTSAKDYPGQDWLNLGGN